MENAFSRMLLQYRKEAGFKTVYQFYHKNGGAGVLKMGYRNYLNIEHGKSLPPLDRLGPVLWALRIEHGSAKANALVAAWLQSTVGEDNFKDYVAPLLTRKPAPPGLSPMQDAMKRVVAAKTVYMTMEQVRAIHTTPEHHLCFFAITTDSEAWTTKDLSGRIKLPEQVVKNVMKTLLAAKLVKKARGNAYQNAFGRACQRYPNYNTMPQDLKNKIRENNAKLIENGEVVYPRRVVVRADGKEFGNFFQLVDAHMNAAASYAVPKRSDTTALFMVEGSVIKLRDF